MKKRRSFKGARVLLTGASSGIGRETALELARRGATLAVLARREEPLRTLVAELGGDSFYLVGDVCDAAFRARALSETLERFGGLDVLVNNAGAGATLRVEETSETLARDLFELNFFAPFELTKAAFPALLESAKAGRDPLVVNLASIVGVRGTPHYGVYGAAKAALLTLADAWRAETTTRGIDFLTVSPGTTETEFFDVLKENRSQPFWPRHKNATPVGVAKALVDAAARRKNRIIPHPPSRILDRLNRFCPRLADALYAAVAGK